MNIVSKYFEEQSALSNELTTYSSKIRDKQIASEKKLWEHVIKEYPKFLQAWIEINLYESLMILSYADNLAKNPTQEHYVFHSDSDSEKFCVVPNFAHCKYALGALVFGVGKNERELFFKKASSDAFAHLIEIDKGSTLDFLEFDRNFNGISYRAKMKAGTEPLVEFMRSVIDQKLESSEKACAAQVHNYECEIINLDKKLMNFTKDILKQKADIEENIWNNVVASCPEELKAWVKSNLFESLMILSKVNSLTASGTESPWLLESPQATLERINISSVDDCKYVEAAIHLGVATKINGELYKGPGPIDGKSLFLFEIPIYPAHGIDPKFMELEVIDSSILSYRAKLKDGTKPLVDFIRSIIDPMI